MHIWGIVLLSLGGAGLVTAFVCVKIAESRFVAEPDPHIERVVCIQAYMAYLGQFKGEEFDRIAAQQPEYLRWTYRKFEFGLPGLILLVGGLIIALI